MAIHKTICQAICPETRRSSCRCCMKAAETRFTDPSSTKRSRTSRASPRAHNLISAKLRFRLQVARLLCPSNGTFTCFAKRSGAKSGEAVLGGVTISYSLRSSSSGVGFWKKAIHGFMASLDIRKLSLEGRKFLSTSRLNSSSSGTSR